MTSILPENLKTLWNLTGIVDPLNPEENWNGYFEDIGLILLTPEVDLDRNCLLPINSLTFATTGGGSVHFSLVSIKGIYSNLSPVVMTVPNCSDKSHMIVGENFNEFIGLGIRTGYFMMEELAYNYSNFEQAILPYEQNHYFDEWVTSKKEENLLKKLEITFKSNVWNNPKERLIELEELYFKNLNIDYSVLE